VILIDANLLLYAYHPRAEQHENSRAWLEAALSGPDLVRFAWLTLWAFLRIATSPRVFDRPLSPSEAEARYRPGSPNQPPASSSQASGTGRYCADLCATARPRARWLWMPSLPRSRSSTAPRSAPRIATSFGSPGSGGATRSLRTADRVPARGCTASPSGRDPRQYWPSRPGEFHAEPRTEPDVTVSRHPARASARRLLPSIEHRVLPVAG
jgi:predicted nucleic acid-binding protein